MDKPSKKYVSGQRVTISHPDYGSVQGTVHVLGNARPYVPLGFTHFTLGKRLEMSGWKVTDGWTGSASDRVSAVLDSWDTETTEPTQGALVEAVRAALDPNMGEREPLSEAPRSVPSRG